MNSHTSAQSLDFLTGGGRMEQRIRALDWSRTPLGPLEGWPQSLKTALKIALNSRYPIWLGWGKELVNLYNDPYIPVLGKRDEWALGASAREVWKEAWDEHLGPQADAVLLRGEATWNDQRQMVFYRNGYAEETYFTFSFSPLPADEGGVGGLFCACTEDTQKVLGERRLAALRQLATDTADERTEQGAAAAAARVLAKHGGDIAFALIYLIASDGGSARLAAGTAGTEVPWAAQRHPLVATPDAQEPWPLSRAMAEGKLVLRGLPAERQLPGGVWPEPASTVAVLPLSKAGHDQARGFLVVGASPRLPFDANYESFFELLGRGVADALSNARAYEEEKKRAEALAELDRAKTAFFSNVSHEFRTPLTLMLGPVQELLQKAETLAQPAVREDLEIVHRNSLRLLRLVNTMLDFSRIEAGRARASFQPTELSTLTADLASSFRSACERAGLQLQVDCLPLPQPVFVDRDMWEKIVLNLVSNAFKFTLAGTISVRLQAEDGHAALSVTDTGVGIPEEELPRMFERFHRVTQTRGRTHEGTGIGLALVQELVKLHGGSVSVASTLGAGSTFSVRIPFGSSHLDAAHIGAATGLISTATGSAAFVEEALRWLPGANPATAVSVPAEQGADRVLVMHQAAGRPRVVWADDNADMRGYVARLLQDRYEVEICADGEAALQAVRRHRPDLVLSDIMMPRLDGMGLLRAIRADTRLADVPVILLSARAGEESRIEGAVGGADDYLIKPFSARELVARVEMHARLSRMRRASQATQRENEQRFRAFIQATSDAVYRMSADWQEMLFLDGRGFIADTTDPSRAWAETYIPAEDRPQVLAAIEQALQTQSIFSLEHRVLRVDGTPGWTFSRAIPIRDAEGRIAEWFGAASDVTARKEAELALRESEEQFRRAIEDAPIPIIMHAEDGEVLQVSRTWTQLTGYSREDASVIRDWLTRAYGFGGDAVRAAVHHVFQNGGTPLGPVEFRIMTRSGETRDWLFSASAPGRLRDGRRFIVGMAQDITERKQAEQALLEMDRRKDEFIATLSHELRNPLAPLVNSLHLLRLGAANSTDVARIQEVMERQANHLVRLVDDLLELSRISRGTLELRRERVEIATVVRNACETVEPLIRAGRHRFEVSLPPESLWVDGDPVRLAQVITNLLNNATRYSDPEGPIALQVRREGQWVLLIVRDHGIGIEPEGLARLFEMFSRGEQLSGRGQGGLGIGLALARRLAEMHGGAVEAASDGPGKGASFTVRLPLVEADSAVSSQGGGSMPQMQGVRVLVVDDNRDAAISLAALLRTLGAHARSAHDGTEALDAYRDHLPDVVLLDIGMPGMDGYEVARRLRAIPSDRRPLLVALTGWGQEEDRQRAVDAGFDHHLVKPADLRALLAVLATGPASNSSRTTDTARTRTDAAA
jgi:PAS domain S-box-containing protein